jgi:curved DNA-binding protein
VNVDYYKTLGLTKSVSQSEIKNMYYKLCYEYHPDRAGTMHQDKFKAINAAYQVL